MSGERWAPIPGMEGSYEASDHGRVRSLRRTIQRRDGKPYTVSESVLRPKPNRYGYLQLTLHQDDARLTRTVHQLVAAAFIGPQPAGQEVRHLNGEQTDNRLSNLLYGTPSENRQDSLRHRTHAQVRKTHCPRNHPYDEANTCRRSNGSRQCRACARTRGRARRVGSLPADWQPEPVA